MVAGQQVIGFQVPCKASFYHFLWQSRSRRIFIPLTFGYHRFQIVSDNLLVETHLLATGFPVIGGPKRELSGVKISSINNGSSEP